MKGGGVRGDDLSGGEGSGRSAGAKGGEGESKRMDTAVWVVSNLVMPLLVLSFFIRGSA